MIEFLETIADHWITFPLVLPLLGAFATPLFGRQNIELRRAFTALVLLGTVAASIFHVEQAAGSESLFLYQVSGWAPPFGIALVVDRLSAAMVTMTSVLGLGAYLYAMFGDDRRRYYFHFLFLVQIAGLNGAFLTGDLFNLFVFFEVLLIASYNLLAYGGGRKRTRAGIQYVVLNLVGSALFLISLGVLYGLTGTLNMADMAARVAALPASETAIARSGAVLLTIVFSIKAALLPLYFWLPRAYGSAIAPVAALFAVMTKVGVYAILRTSTIIFGNDAGIVSNITQGWLIPLALVTLVFAALGVAAARRLQVMVAYLIVVSVGTILVPVGIGTPESIAASLYYIVHSTFITAALFLVTDLIADKRGEAGDSLVEGPAITGSAWLGLMFFVAALVVAGLPPTSGFLGKVFILESATGHPLISWIWGIILGSSLLSLIALALAGSHLFWETERGVARESIDRPGKAMAPLFLFGLIVGWTAFAGPAYDYMTDAAEQTLDRDGYIDAVHPKSFDPDNHLESSKHGSQKNHH